MNKADRKLLLKNRLAFVEGVEATDLLGYLYQDGVISENDKENIEAQVTRRSRIEHLLDLLPRKGPLAFRKFCGILDQFEGYQYLARTLMPSKYSGEGNGVDIVDASPTDEGTHLQLKHAVDQISLEPKRQLDKTDSYLLTSKPRGWCFIINNMHFFKHSDRKGSEIDAHNLQVLFTTLGFRVWLVNNVDAIDIRDKFHELAHKTNHGDCLVVCILSHGLSGQIYGIEGQLVSVSEILDILNDGPAATLLKGKPKLFLIQACRDAKQTDPNGQDKKTDSSLVICAPISLDLEVDPDVDRCESLYASFIEESKIQAYSDLVLAYSTFPGELSWRHTTKGSYFIDSVIDVFTQYSSSEDVLGMLVKVNRQVLEKISKEGKEQIPAPVFTLTKKFYLHPP